ncbi:hypothetical protein V8B97DRAFT_2026326 [Scleroderma yunnanense]
MDWHHATPEKRWLYAKFITLDANFHLHHKNVSSDKVDPDLSKGWSYFIKETSYQAFIEEHKYDTQEVCYLFFSSLHNCQLSTLIIPYDIASQWSRNLWKWMTKFPGDYHLPHEQKIIKFLIPKFHLPAHISHCQVTYSFNFTPHVGHTNGEAPECGWANINPAASSTKKMRLGTHQDTLDDYFGDWNWKCITQLDKELRELEACIDEISCNPYEIHVATITQASIQLELVRAEASELQAGNDISLSPHSEVSASILISSGLERLLEAEISSLGSHPTDNQLSKLQEYVQPGGPVKVEQIKLYLPSEIGYQASCPVKLCEHKWRLCEAQAYEALCDMHNLLQLQAYFYEFKDANMQGQVTNTHAWTTINVPGAN